MKRGLFVLIASSIFFIGLLMVFNASSAEILNRHLNKNLHFASIKQILCALIGIGLGFFAYKLGYAWFLKYSGHLMVLSTLLLILVFVPKIGVCINGGHRWIRLLGFSFQPSELIKCFMPLHAIFFIHKEKYTFMSFFRRMSLFCIPVLLIFIEPDNGTVFILVLLMVATFFLTRVPARFWLLPLCVAMICGGILIARMPHARARVQVYLNPELDLRGKGHQPYQAKIAMGSGGLFGKGLSHSFQKLEYLPEAQNDYIAAIFAEEFGFFGISLLLVFYLLLSMFGFLIAQSAPDKKGFQVASVLTFTLLIQVFLNLGVVSNLLPSTGINLPLFSQGGTSIMVTCLMIGLILSCDPNAKPVDLKPWLKKTKFSLR
ncbi:MAG: putative lipid II flippase FtsW [Chlamydiae bacterium]|nr:putative lipid II flippase FtsW [Chlamydiota bacterium]